MLFCSKTARRRNDPHQTMVQRFPIRESSSLHIHLTATHKPAILLNIKHAGRTGREQRCDCNGTPPQAACVGTWETGVEVILTRCWNSRLRIRFCCSKSNTRVRSFTHSSFKSWKRRQTELNWTERAWGLNAWRRGLFKGLLYFGLYYPKISPKTANVLLMFHCNW